MSIEYLEDNGQDAKYFIVTPQLVWALSQDPYDFMLWNVVKMVAGEEGECYLNTRQLAVLAMMSVGKVTESRKRLLDVGLLEGEIRRDPGFRQSVWHLRIPDLWRRNLEWRESHHEFRARLQFKEDQASVHQVNTCAKRSPHELERSPGETKNIPEEQHQGDGDDGSCCESCFDLLTQAGFDEGTAQKMARTAHSNGWGSDACRLVVYWEKYTSQAEQKGRAKNRLGLLRHKIATGAIPAKWTSGEPMPGDGDGDQREAERRRRRYLGGEWADIIEH